MNFSKTKPNNLSLDQLVVNLKKEDTQYSKLSRIFQIFYWVFIPLYAIMTYRLYSDSQSFIHLVSGACYIVAFAIFAIFFGKYYKEYKNVDYSLPTLFMLKKAAYRYNPFQLRALIILVAILFMDAAISIQHFSDLSSFLFVQMLLLGGFGISFLVGLLLWYYKYKPLRDNALKLIAEIEEN